MGHQCQYAVIDVDHCDLMLVSDKMFQGHAALCASNVVCAKSRCAFTSGCMIMMWVNDQYRSCALCLADAILSEGKLFPPSLTKNIPQPAAFFPLTEGSGDHVSSFPNPTYLGTLNGSIPCVPTTLKL